MAAPTPDQADLWRAALADAGIAEDEVDLVITSTAPTDPNALGGGYLHPGADPGVDPPLPLTDAEVQELSDRRRHRVAVYEVAEPTFLLGLMRWCLELMRQQLADRDFLPVAMQINGAWDRLFSGLGSAVMYHALPVFDDADLAAGHLVTRHFGPQHGNLYGPFGSLLRADRPAGTLETLPQRLTASAAIYAEEFTATFASELSRDLVLQQLSDDAPQWWARLLDDEDFNALRRASLYYRPTQEEIDRLVAEGHGAAELWRPLARHLHICIHRGLDVLS